MTMKSSMFKFLFWYSGYLNSYNSLTGKPEIIFEKYSNGYILSGRLCPQIFKLLLLYIRFSIDWNSPFPNSKALIIRRAHKSPILINKNNGVDSSQMPIIFLHNFSTSNVPLYKRENVKTEVEQFYENKQRP